MDPLAQLLGDSPVIAALREQVRRLMARQAESRRAPPVLIQGETGTGKGLLARALHAASARAAGPFVDVNCAAIPETLLEAEMFGVERGAFTDARQPRPGLFQMAHRGTIFLDEVGLLPESLQAKLLKVIEERAVRRLGGTRNEPVDVWVVAATNEDLAAAVGGRRFRADLYHRLAVVTLALPPLRDRGGDVLLLAEHFLTGACDDYGMPPKRLTPATRQALAAYLWPGNIRELSNVIERVALLADADVVTPDMLGLPAAAASAPSPAASAEAPRPLEAAVDDVERQHLLAALEATGWNVTRAAARLGVSRNTLRYRMEKHGLRSGAAAPRRAGAARQPGATTTPGAAAAVAPAPAAPSPPGITRERRRLALLAVTLTGTQGPDGVSMARRALEVIVDKVRSFGGRVEELSRARIVAVFGVEPVEDAPVRAANAALAALNGIDRLRRAEGLRLAATTAVHVDHFVVAGGGEGPALDLEARLHAWTFLDSLLAAGGADGVVVSASAAGFLERRFDLLPAALGEPGSAYRLAGRERGGLAPQGRMTPFVGRQQELELLHSRLASAARGQGQIVGITGDPGIGKSRLLAEFRRALADRRVTCLEGHCVSYGATIPYAPVLDIVRAACQAVDSDPSETLEAKLSAALAEAGIDPDTGAPPLLHLLGAKVPAESLAGLDPDVIKRRAFDSLRQLLLQRSRPRPLVLVIEDLHWIDRASEEFLASFADLVAGAPILMLSTYRAGYRLPWIDRSYASQMALHPLEPAASGVVVRSALGSAAVDETVVEMILVRGEGNPFFLEELARTVGETGAVESALVVPATVQAVVLARIERLPPMERHVLQVAAVIGKDVPLPLLREVAGVPEEHLQESLGRLRAAELLQERRVDVQPHYTFRHALTHEVAYDCVGPSRRRELHDAIVTGMERLYHDRLDDHIERLADHAFRAERWDRAATYLRSAGLKAAERSAHREAVACFEQALLALNRLSASVTVLEQAIDLRFHLRTSLTPLGEHRLVVEHLEEARRLAETLGDPRRLGRVSAYMADCARLMGRYDEAIQAGRRALAIARELDDFALQIASTMYVGQAHYNLGLYRAAADLFRRNVAVLAGERDRESFGMPYIASVHARTWLIWCLAELGAFDEGVALGKEALDIAEAAGHPFSLTSAYAGLARPHLRRGDVEPAVELLRRGLALGRTWNIRLLLPALCADLGLAYAMLGRMEEALPLLQQAADYQSAMRGTAGQAPRFTSVGEAHLRAGDRHEARHFAERALELARFHGERGNEAYAQRLLGEIAAGADPPDGGNAEGAFRAALSIAEALEMRPLAARCHLGLATLHRRAGDAELAGSAARVAIRLFDGLGMSAWLARAEAERGASPGTP